MNLAKLNFNEEQIRFISSIINTFGSDKHPVCDVNSFKYFNVNYLKKIISENENNFDGLNEKGKTLLKQVKNILK